MDGSRFDRMTRDLGRGASRRTVLKGLFGIGGAAIVAEIAFDDAESARRPTPTPRATATPSCQGGLVCGPDCCIPGQSECCDNACCFGECYGEELCCPTGNVVCDGVACCRPNEVCVNGQCRIPTPANTPTSTATHAPTQTSTPTQVPTQTPSPSATPQCSDASDCGICTCLDDYRYRCPECIRGTCGGSVGTCPENYHCADGGCVPDIIPDCEVNADCGDQFCEGDYVMRPTCLAPPGVCYNQQISFCFNAGCNPETAQCNPS